MATSFATAQMTVHEQMILQTLFKLLECWRAPTIVRLVV